MCRSCMRRVSSSGAGSARKNAWSGPEAEPIAQTLMEYIDRATFSPDRAAAAYAAEKADIVAENWRGLLHMVSKLQPSTGEIEIYRQAGALSPLLEALEQE